MKIDDAAATIVRAVLTGALIAFTGWCSFPLKAQNHGSGDWKLPADSKREPIVLDCRGGTLLGHSEAVGDQWVGPMTLTPDSRIPTFSAQALPLYTETMGAHREEGSGLTQRIAQLSAAPANSGPGLPSLMPNLMD